MVYIKKKKYRINEKKRSWVPIGIYLLSSTVNPAQFGQELAGLAVLLSMQANPKRLPGYFFLINICIIFFLKYETIDTYARAFFMVIILSIGGVKSISWRFESIFWVTHKH